MASRSGRRFIIEVVSDTKKFNTGMSRMGRTLRNVGLALGAREIIRGIGDTIQASSDLVEAQNAVDQVFGATASTIHDFGKDSARAVGISSAAFEQLSVVMGGVLQNKGVADYTDKTVTLTQRAADMASVFNTDVSDAMNAINSLFLGQTRPIREYAVNILQADVNARALADSGKTAVKELTNQEKALATFNLLMEQTAKTEGDFVRTSGDLANQTRILKAEWTNLQAEFGNAAMPAAVDTMSFLLDTVRLMPGAFADADLALHRITATGQAFTASMLEFYTLGLANTDATRAGANQNERMANVINAYRRYLGVLTETGDAHGALISSITDLAKTNSVNMTSVDDLREKLHLTHPEMMMLTKEAAAQGAAAGLSADQIAALVKQADRLSKSSALITHMTPTQAQAAQWAAYVDAMSGGGEALEPMVTKAGELEQAMRDALQAEKDLANYDPYGIWDYETWDNLIGDLKTTAATYDEITAAIGRASAAGRRLPGQIPPPGGIGGRDAGAPQTVINFNGVVGDPVEVGRQVKDTLAAYADVRGI